MNTTCIQIVLCRNHFCQSFLALWVNLWYTMRNERYFMPKKTRKEKLLADLRRKQNLYSIRAEELNIIAKNQPKPTDDSVKKITYSSLNKNKTGKETSGIPINYIYKDLRRTLILTTLAFVFELVLYWRGRF